MTQQVYETKPHSRVFTFTSLKTLFLDDITQVIEHDNYLHITHKRYKKDKNTVRTTILISKLDYFSVFGPSHVDF